MADDQLPRFLLDLLASPPVHGQGVHKWMYSVSRYLHALRSEGEILEILAAKLHDCGRRIPDREIQAAIRDSKKAQWVPGEKQSVVYQSTWPKFNKLKWEGITSKGSSAYDMWEASPVRFMDDKAYTKVIIEYLFPGNPYLCMGLSSTEFESKRKCEWMADDISKQQFMVPSACIAETGVTKEGRASAHCLDNTGPRQYLVIEQDTGDQDQQVAVIQHLTKYLPLCLVLSSGGKSLHAWFPAELNEDEMLKFMKEAASVGADPATWSRSQFVRVPDGLRDSGARQSVLYFDPPEIA